MTPQLFINYRLKSVAHLPWRVFMYKIFSTFIDDVFAFIIAMPLKHRLACFRDDIVFFVFLYQAYLYPVDKTRANEYGIAYEEKKTTHTLKKKMANDTGNSGDVDDNDDDSDKNIDKNENAEP